MPVFTSTNHSNENHYDLYLKVLHTLFSNEFLKIKHSAFSMTYFYEAGKAVSYEYVNENLNVSLNETFEFQIKDKLSEEVNRYRNDDFKINEARNTGDHTLARELFNINRERVRQASESLFRQNNSSAFIPASRNMPTSRPDLLDREHISESAQNEKGLTYANDDELEMFLILSWQTSQHYHQNNPFIKSNRSSLEEYYVRLSNQILKAKLIKIDEIEYVLNNEIKTPLQIASTGQQEVVRILQHLFSTFYVRHSTINFIEEPEAHLFPEAQKYLIQLMALMANKTDSQVVITTHSPYILSVVNNLLFYAKTIQRNPQAHDVIKEHFGLKDLDEKQEERIYLKEDEVRIYSLGKENEGDEYFKSLIDPETGLIGANFLDEHAEKMYQDFDFMYPLNRKEKASL